MKRFYKHIIAAIAVAAALSSCARPAPEGRNARGGGSAQPAKALDGQPVEIEFMHIYTGDIAAFIDRLIEGFNASQPRVRATATFGGASYSAQMEKYQTLAAVNKQPDVSIVGLSYARYVEANMPIVPIESFMAKEGYDTSDYYPTMLDLGRGADGKVWMLPFAVSTPVMYYNTSLFKSAGLNPDAPPSTFSQVKAAAKKISALGSGVQGFNTMGITDTEGWVFQALIESMGGSLMSADGKGVTLDSEPGRKALSFVTDMIFKDKSMQNMNVQQGVQLLMAGKVGMYFSSCAMISMLGKNPQIAVAPFPSDGENAKRVPAGGNCIAISRSSPEKEAAAWELVKYLTSPESTAAVAKSIMYMATRRGVVGDDQLLGGFLKENPNAAVSYRQIDSMVPWQNYPGDNSTKITQVIQDKLQAALSGQLSPEEALRQAASEASALLR